MRSGASSHRCRCVEFVDGTFVRRLRHQLVLGLHQASHHPQVPCFQFERCVDPNVDDTCEFLQGHRVILLLRELERSIAIRAALALHDQAPRRLDEAGLVILADAISASRPGARAESMTSYIERLGRLEKLAMTMPGVQQAFAIQAGREVRVVVQPSVVTDEQAQQLAKNLRLKIEQELDYPSTIKITVIREQRYTETAT